MNWILKACLLAMMASASLEATATPPEGFHFSHSGWCSYEELKRGLLNYGYSVGGKDGGSQRSACLEPESESNSLREHGIDYVFDVLSNSNGPLREERCCGGHLSPRECPCPY